MWVAVGELLLKRLTTPLSTINKKIRLEAYTEHSESNPGRSLGTINKKKHSCLEDSTLSTEYERSVVQAFTPFMYCIPDNCL